MTLSDVAFLHMHSLVLQPLRRPWPLSQEPLALAHLKAFQDPVLFLLVFLGFVLLPLSLTYLVPFTSAGTTLPLGKHACQFEGRLA